MYYSARFDGEIMADAVARVCDEGEYDGVEIADLPDRAIRLRIGETARAHKLRVAVWQAERQQDTEWGMSNPDSSRRRAAIAALKEGLDNAAESGASDLLYIGRLDPGPDVREEARQCLAESLGEMAGAAAAYAMRVVFEPLDRGVDQPGLIGRTADAAAMIETLQADHPNLRLAWDTSHAALSGDDLDTALRRAYPLLAQIHLANVIVDPDHVDYGDHHRALGPPGLLTTERIAAIFRLLADLRQEEVSPPYLSFEVRTQPGDDPAATERHTRQMRETAWQMARGDES
jgi:sugar phosphate isomerase/epimerase